MPDPVGGREAEIEAVMLVLWPEFRVHDTVHRRRAGDVIAALDAVRSSGSAAQNQDAARRAAHEAAQDWVDAAGGDEVDTGHVVDAALDAYRFHLRSFGSAAQNRKERPRCPQCGAANENGCVGPPFQSCFLALAREWRSPQDEDHEEN